MTTRTLVNGVPDDAVCVRDRGFTYGDGLFESVRFVAMQAPLWSRHMRRLHESCRRLHMPLPDAGQLWREALEAVGDMPHAVLRITLTRGSGSRGYAPPASPQPTRVVAAFDLPSMPEAVHAQGIRMCVCRTRLAEQPLLAGMKHLNRLEQVLARAEWDDPAIAEGLLCDTHGRVVSATMANLFAVIDGEPVTPRVDRCGIAGVARAEVLAVHPSIRVADLALDALHGASEVFLGSSVRGIVPVRMLGEWRYRPGPLARQLQQHWHNLGFPGGQVA